MRTMKKIVALSLVLAMALSMMASAASFKDQATINADLLDEINLLVALNIFSEQGTGAGFFEPSGTITRSQAAKMIYVLKNKGVDNGATSWTGLNIFNDVEAGAWYEGYVNYCASTGIIAGTGDNKFTPNGQLTGVELAKLLLVVIGYKADIEGYTGNNWASNVLADAEAAGIFVDYELPVRSVITREWAAKMIVNAINATKVRYADGERVEMYTQNNQPITYATQDLGLVKWTGVVMATQNVELGTGAINEDGDNKYSAILFDDDNDVTLVEYDVDEALLGQRVDMLFKGNTNAFDSTAKIYGITANEKVKVAETTVDAISVSKVDDDEIKVKVNGVEKKMPMSTTIKVYVDYTHEANALTQTWASIQQVDGEDTFVKTPLFDGLAAGANDGRAVKLIDNNDDGIYDVAHVGSVVYGEVSYINAANHTFRATNMDSITTEEAYDKLVFVDTVAKEDIIKVTKDVTSGVEKTVIEKLDKVTGAISKVTNETTATLEGSEYKLAAEQIIGSDYAFATDTKAQDYFVDGKYVVYTDAIGSTGSDIQTNIAYVIHAGAITDDWTGVATNKVEILKNDGTREILVYDEDIDDAEPFAELAPNTVYEYVMKDGKLGLVELEGDGIGTTAISESNSGKEFDKSANKFFSNTETYLVNDETYFFVVDLAYDTVEGEQVLNIVDSKYAVMKASEINGDMNSTANVKFGYAHDGLPYLYFAVLGGSNPGGDGSTGIGIAAGNVTETRVDGEKIFSLEVTKLDGTKVTLTNTTDVFSAVKNQFVTYGVGSKENSGTATKLTAVDTATTSAYEADAIKTVDGNKVMLVANGYMEIASDAKIYYIDAYKSGTSDRVMVSESDALVEAAELGETEGVVEYAQNILFKVDNDGKIATIICEVDGEALTCYTAAE